MVSLRDARRAPCVGALRARSPWKSLLNFRAALTALALIVILVAEAPSPLYHVLPAVAVQETNKCDTTGIRTTCSCEIDDQKSLEATISEGVNEFEMYCKKQLACAPNNLNGSIVCPTGKGDLIKCKDLGDTTNCLDVNKLLHGRPSTVQWKDGKAVRNEGMSRVLAIPKDNFPYVDGQFLVGCSDGSSTTKCKVAVTVAARATETKDQQVTCSYGKDSNKKHQTITLSPSQNSFTLVCGEKGEIVQTNYKKTYCDVSEENAAVKDCPGKYKDILPGYEEGW